MGSLCLGAGSGHAPLAPAGQLHRSPGWPIGPRPDRPPPKLSPVAPVRYHFGRGGVGSAENDAELVEAVRSGDTEAFSELYRAHAGVVRAVAYSQVHDREAAADIVQDTFFRALRNLGSLQDPLVSGRGCCPLPGILPPINCAPVAGLPSSTTPPPTSSPTPGLGPAPSRS